MLSKQKITAISLGIVVLIIVGYFATGGYNVAADNPHWSLTSSALDFIREQSIARRASRVEIPNDLDNEARISKGAKLYDEMCVDCHLAPGIKETVLHEGLYPQPPALANVNDLEANEAFYIITHGIKMTAMPAWGKSHNKELIWDMVAFLQKLPTLTPEQYSGMTGNSNAQGHDHHGHNSGHGNLRCGGD